MKASYNTETKEITTTASVGEFRCLGIGLALFLGGPGMAQHVLEGVVNAADESSTDEDYQNRVEAFFDHVDDEHAPTDIAKEIVAMLRVMAVAIPRQSIMEEHFRQLGKQDASASESFNA